MHQRALVIERSEYLSIVRDRRPELQVFGLDRACIIERGQSFAERSAGAASGNDRGAAGAYNRVNILISFAGLAKKWKFQSNIPILRPR